MGHLKINYTVDKEGDTIHVDVDTKAIIEELTAALVVVMQQDKELRICVQAANDIYNESK